MRRGHRRGTGAAVRSAVVAAVTVLVLVAGCDASSDPSPGAPLSASTTRPVRPTAASTPSPTPTPTADPAVVAPTPPAALTDVGADGASGDEAIAVARYFVGLYGYVFATHDLAAWSALSSPDCVFCASVVTNSDLLKSEGKRVTGSFIVLEAPVVAVGRPGELFLVEGAAVQEELQVLDSAGTVTGEAPESRSRAHCALQYSQGVWTILEYNTD